MIKMIGGGRKAEDTLGIKAHPTNSE